MTIALLLQLQKQFFSFQLRKKVTLSEDIKPIDLPDDGAAIHESLKLLGTGYGSHYPSWTKSRKLRIFYMRVVESKRCEKEFGAMDNMFCAVASYESLACQVNFRFQTPLHCCLLIKLSILIFLLFAV